MPELREGLSGRMRGWEGLTGQTAHGKPWRREAATAFSSLSCSSWQPAMSPPVPGRGSCGAAVMAPLLALLVADSGQCRPGCNAAESPTPGHSLLSAGPTDAQVFPALRSELHS